MSDSSLLLDLLNQTLKATQRVEKRFKTVGSADYFTGKT